MFEMLFCRFFHKNAMLVKCRIFVMKAVHIKYQLSAALFQLSAFRNTYCSVYINYANNQGNIEMIGLDLNGVTFSPYLRNGSLYCGEDRAGTSVDEQDVVLIDRTMNHV